MARWNPRIGRFHLRIAGLAVLAGLAGTHPSSAQPPATEYQALFRDPSVTTNITLADLPNLGRLVSLEATSMYLYARSDLMDSPRSYLLLNAIMRLWNAADAFTAAAGYYPMEYQRISAALLVYPDLELAYYQVRNQLVRLPAASSRALVSFEDMSRVMAVIRPLLEMASLLTPAGAGTAVPATPTLADQARSLSSSIAPITTAVASATQSRQDLGAFVRQVDVLQKLIQGFERISSDPATERELVLAFRPIRDLAQSLNRAGPRQARR